MKLKKNFMKLKKNFMKLKKKISWNLNKIYTKKFSWNLKKINTEFAELRVKSMRHGTFRNPAGSSQTGSWHTMSLKKNH